MQLTAKDIATRLSRNGRIGHTPGGYTTCCPAHDDRNASLNVGTGDNGGISTLKMKATPTENAVNTSNDTAMYPFPEGTIEGGGPNA